MCSIFKRSGIGFFPLSFVYISHKINAEKIFFFFSFELFVWERFTASDIVVPAGSSLSIRIFSHRYASEMHLVIQLLHGENEKVTF